MPIKKNIIQGIEIIQNPFQSDERGVLIKPYSILEKRYDGLQIQFQEIYYSISKKNVIRGMHFQIPPFEHTKMIYLTRGRVLDVLLDLRKSSMTYLKYESFELEAHKYLLIIPPGVAHGFLSLEDYSTIVYNQTSPYSKEHDFGILWNSFGFDWGISDPIMSERDISFPQLAKYKSPF